jgi:cytochrome c553
MTMIAQMLSDDDIENVSEWYSRIKVKVFDPEIELSEPN